MVLKKKKSQVSVEMIVIVGVLILGAVILAALFLGFSRAQTDTATDLDTGFSSTLDSYLTDIGIGVESGSVGDADYVQLYNLTLLTNPDGVGIVTGAGTYQLGDLVNVEATLPAGYIFSGWSTSSGQVLNLNLNYSFNMPATDLILYANYSLDSYNLSVSKIGTGSGLVTSSPDGINCGSFCTSNYVHGTSVTLNAAPSLNNTFVGWNGEGCSGTGSCTVTMNQNRFVTANFAVSNCTLSLTRNPSAGGSVSGDGTYQCGSSRTVTAASNVGYDFVSWTNSSGSVVSTSPSYTFNLNNDTTLQANFAISNCTLSLTRNPSAGGSVSGAGTYQCGTSRTVTATTNSGYDFVSWTNSSGIVVSTSPSYTFNLNNNTTLQANFAISNCTLSLTRNPSAGGSVSGAGTYQCGTSRTVTAASNVGYDFVSWTNSSGSVVSTSPSYTFNLNNNTTLQANFAISNCTLTIINSPVSGGSTSPSNSVTQQCGTSVTLTANPSIGYNFDRWTNSSGNFLSFNNPYNYVLSSNTTIYANYNFESYNLTLLTNPVIGGHLSGSGKYNYNDSVTVTATPILNYNFLNWTNSLGQVVSNSSSYTFNMPSNNYTLTANFEIVCPDTVDYMGFTYNVRRIGDQCWFEDNLRAGEVINSNLNQTDNSIIEKYCYNNNSIYCNSYGGLYQGEESRNYVSGLPWNAPIQGICPTGWRIPTANDLIYMTYTNHGDYTLNDYTLSDLERVQNIVNFLNMNNSYVRDRLTGNIFECHNYFNFGSYSVYDNTCANFWSSSGNTWHITFFISEEYLSLGGSFGSRQSTLGSNIRCISGCLHCGGGSCLASCD